MKNILSIKEPESGWWAVSSGVCIAGNYTLERFLAEIQKEMDTKNEKPHSHYLWKTEGKRWSNDNKLLAECDRWHLSRYEVCTPPDESKYQAVVILYYEPAVEVAIAA